MKYAIHYDPLLKPITREANSLYHLSYLVSQIACAICHKAQGSEKLCQVTGQG